jgi:hypothetical protein
MLNEFTVNLLLETPDESQSNAWLRECLHLLNGKTSWPVPKSSGNLHNKTLLIAEIERLMLDMDEGEFIRRHPEAWTLLFGR